MTIVCREEAAADKCGQWEGKGGVELGSIFGSRVEGDFEGTREHKDSKCIKRGQGRRMLGMPGGGKWCGLYAAKWLPNGVLSIQNAYQEKVEYTRDGVG